MPGTADEGERFSRSGGLRCALHSRLSRRISTRETVRPHTSYSRLPAAYLYLLCVCTVALLRCLSVVLLLQFRCPASSRYLCRCAAGNDSQETHELSADYFSAVDCAFRYVRTYIETHGYAEIRNGWKKELSEYVTIRLLKALELLTIISHFS